MYDEYLRSKCYNPQEYDRMIVLIMQHNSSCRGVDWACNAINDCIREVVLRDSHDMATGMCMAIRSVKRDKDGKDIVTARLSLTPLEVDDGVDQLGQIIRKQQQESL